MRKTILILLITSSLLSLGACRKYEVVGQDNTNASRNVEIANNQEAYKNAALSMIKEGEASADGVFTQEFAILGEDINPEAELTNWYIFNNAIYIQVGNTQNDAYMYRFQLNNSNLIESYIKYSLEG